MRLSYSAFFSFSLLLSILLRLLLSNPTLEHFYPYASEGGGPIQKVHPGTWIIIVMFALAVSMHGTRSLFIRQKLLVQAFFATCCVITYSALVFGVSGVAYFIDTYLYACICLFFIVSMPSSKIYVVRNFFVIFAFVNALLSLYESIAGAVLMPNALDFGFFRAYALLGHPLNNGLIMATIGLMVIGCRLNALAKVVILPMILMSLILFGARGALAVFLLTVAISIVFGDYKHSNIFKDSVLMGLIKLCIAGLVVGGTYVIIFHTAIGASINERLIYDDSVGARVESLLILERMSVGDYFWGVGMAGVQEAVAGYSDISIIENFFVFMILQIGVPATILLLFPYIKAAVYYAKSAGFDGWVLAIGFILAAGTNNSLSVKTPALAVFFLSLYCIGCVITSKNSGEGIYGAGRVSPALLRPDAPPRGGPYTN